MPTSSKKLSSKALSSKIILMIRIFDDKDF
jgi:hypothetical protein